LRRHLRHLVVTATRCPMLVGWVMVHLVGTGLEMGLLLRVIAADWGHVSRLLRRVYGLAMLPRGHEHHRLGGLTGLRVLVHHHGSTPTGTGIATVRLGRWHMLGIRVARIWGIHLHLGCIGGHALRNTHVWSARWLLNHHWSAHGWLGVDELGTARVMSHMSRLCAGLADIELRHGLAKCKLCMWRHGGRVTVL
jgi:hypothetical protein